MADKVYKILAINPGSTTTKIGVFKNNQCLLEETIAHSAEELSQFEDIADQKDFRLQVLADFLKDSQINLESFDAFSGRGGSLESCVSGTYPINDLLYEHASTMRIVKHPSALGATLAYEFGQKFNKPAFCVNPPDVDEFIIVARITGLPEIYRQSRIHALNQKEVAIRYADSQGKDYIDLNLIVCHIGGGISITAHERGKMIDSNDIVDGDGPMTPNRSGFVPAKSLVKLCFSGKYAERELGDLINKNGGITAWLNTNDILEVIKMIADGNQKAKTIYDAMIYQIAKQVGAMYVSLKSDCDAIILTGQIAHDQYLVNELKRYFGSLAEVVEMPGSFELEALAAGALRVLMGVEKPQVYTGKPVFKQL